MKNFLKKNLLFLLAILLVSVCHGQTTNSPIDTRGQVFRKDTIPLKSKSKTTKRIPKQIRSVPLKKIPVPYRFYAALGLSVARQPFSVKGITNLELPYKIIGDPIPQIYYGTIDGQYYNGYLDIAGTIELGDVKGIFAFMTIAGSPHSSLDVSRFEFGIGWNFVVNNHFKISPTISFGPGMSTLSFPQTIDNRNMYYQIFDTPFPYRFVNKSGETKFSDEIEFRIDNRRSFFSIQCGFSPRIKNRIENDFPIIINIGYTMNFSEQETYIRVLSPAAKKQVSVEEDGITFNNTVSTKNIFSSQGLFVQLSFFINSQTF
jgi:hypothetical protein